MPHPIDRRTLLAGLAAGSVAAPNAAAAAWPERPITVLHGFAAGGNADVVARIIADALATRMNATFVVEPKPGAGGTIAATQVARASPDGYTLGVLPGGHAVSAAIYKQLPYKPVDDFSMLSLLIDFPFVIATHAKHKADTLPKMIAHAKASAEEPVYGSAGNGTGQHMAGELLAALAGIKIKHLPYRGGSAAILDLIGERIDMVIDTPTVMLEQIKAGAVRPLAVTGASRFFALPDVPTVAEGGVAGYETSSWLGLAAPAGLPADIVKRLNSETIAALAQPATMEKLRAIGGNPTPTTPDTFRDRVSADIAKWTKVVTERSIPKI